MNNKTSLFFGVFWLQAVATITTLAGMAAISPVSYTDCTRIGDSYLAFTVINCLMYFVLKKWG